MSEENQDASPALAELPGQLREIGTYFAEYLDAKWDLSKASFRDALLEIVAWSLLTLLGAGMVLIAVGFVFYGAALALAQILGRDWAGYLIAGISLLAVFYLLLYFKIASMKRRSLRQKTKKYERELEEQRRKFGINAVERAAAE